VVVGTRPQYIKLAPFIKEAKGRFNIDIVDTGQHYDESMSGQFRKEFKLPKPRYSLNVGSGGHANQTGHMLIKLERVLDPKIYDMVVVFGDTNSTLAGALAAAKLGIPIAHIEAGTRSFDRSMPEEVNRIVTDALADICFAATDRCALHLRREGKHDDQVFMVGDIMVDSLDADKGNKDTSASLKKHKYSLLTLHRPSNVDSRERLRQIFDVMHDSELPIVFPAHPRTAKRIAEFGIHVPENVKMIDPVNHFQMIHMIENADMVITDSGGVQKEAYLLSTPCITLRNTTEWTETLEEGWNTLIGEYDFGKLLYLMQNPKVPAVHSAALGGPGASKRICDIFEGWGKEHEHLDAAKQGRQD
jgi:UDP-N-acetylglucosamine 2-epimerase (non-hydrolysing)